MAYPIRATSAPRLTCALNACLLSTPPPVPTDNLNRRFVEPAEASQREAAYYAHPSPIPSPPRSHKAGAPRERTDTMTLSEFKAWFEGFSEGIDKAPTEKQFAKIKEKVADIDGSPVTYPFYIERYVNPILPIWPHHQPYQPYWLGTSGGTCSAQTNFDSYAAMQALGRVESMN